MRPRFGFEKPEERCGDGGRPRTQESRAGPEWSTPPREWDRAGVIRTPVPGVGVTYPGPDFGSWSPELQDTPPHCSPSAWKEERASPEAVGRQELLGSAVCRLPPPCHLTWEGVQSDCLPPNPDRASLCGCGSGSSAGLWRVLRRLCCHLQFTRGPGGGPREPCAICGDLQGQLPTRRRHLTSPGMLPFPPDARQAPLSGPQLPS